MMKNPNKIGHALYAVGIAGLAIQQFQYADFRPVLLPTYATHIPLIFIWACLAGAELLTASLLILFSKNAQITAFILGSAFFLFFFFFQVSYQLFVSSYSFHIGLWTDPLKELVLAGGAFIVSASYSSEQLYPFRSVINDMSDILFFVGKIFFSITMMVFGIDHLVYPDFVATLVPAWIPGHLFLT